MATIKDYTQYIIDFNSINKDMQYLDLIIIMEFL
jgi:hypothetical protein